MAHITFIHGICNKPPCDVLLNNWLAALRDDGGIDLSSQGVTSSMVYWADVLYESPEPTEVTETVAAVADDEHRELLRQITPLSGQSQEETEFIAGLAGKFSLVAMKADVQHAAQADSLEAVPLPWSIKGPLMAAFLRDVHHYLFNVEFSPRPGVTYRVQDEIRSRFIRALRDAPPGGPHFVVSHSMGTVIAYDCLKRVESCPQINGLMTIGSPLGLDEVQEKLVPGYSIADGFPSEKVKGAWANTFDRLDPVCGFSPRLAEEYEQLDRVTNQSRALVHDLEQVNQGWWRHDISKYLGGDVCRAALRGLLQAASTESVIAAATRQATFNEFPANSIATTIELEALSPPQLAQELQVAITRSQRSRLQQVCAVLARRLAQPSDQVSIGAQDNNVAVAIQSALKQQFTGGTQGPANSQSNSFAESVAPAAAHLEPPRLRTVHCSDIRRLFGDVPAITETIGQTRATVNIAGAALESVRSAVSSVLPSGGDRTDFMQQLTAALRHLRDEAADQDGDVFFSSPHQLASLLQSAISRAPQAQIASTSGLEMPFDKDDVREVLKEVLDQAKNIQPHEPVRPASADPDELPPDASLFLVSDFGTGQYGAPKIAHTIATSPDDYYALVHLGDVYYSGQPDEVQQRFLDIWPMAKGEINRTLNGNHDMYSGGYGYFDVALPALKQPSSYFALQNKRWTLLFLDTAYQDNDLDKKQTVWINEVADQADDRALVLFSHHPLYSNFKPQGVSLQKKLKTLLTSQRIKAWYWGHEHHCALYDQHPEFGFLGRCLGHGGMPSNRKDFKHLDVEDEVSEFSWLRRGAEEDGHVPPALYLDGPNSDIPENSTKYGPHGYVKLEFSGKKLLETVCSVDGRALRTTEIKASSSN